MTPTQSFFGFITVTIGKTIKHLRTAADQSQGQLARALDVTSSYLSLVEHDKREPSLSFLKQAAKHFEVPVGLFLFQEEQVRRLKSPHREAFDNIYKTLIQYVMTRKTSKTSSRKRGSVRR